MNLSNDKPISDFNEDKLERNDFARSLAKAILTNESTDGLVVLLNGEWGCGKTSIINLIKKQIDIEIENNTSLKFVPIVQDFSPWNVISQDGIIQQFFDTLSSGFSKTRIKKVLKTIKDSPVFQNTFKTLKACHLLTSNPAWKVALQLKDLFDNYVDSFTESKNTIDRKNEIVNKLKESKTRYIIFIDDLDRLNDSELKLVIQLIKSVCDFPNVIYVLSADANIIQAAVKNEQGICQEGDKYLEKIIQVTFDVPMVRKEKISDIAINDINEVFAEKMNNDDVERFNSYYYLGMLNSLNTIRNEKRFINLLKVSYDAFAGELDISDFIAISYLKSLNPKIIQLLVDYSDYLFGKSLYVQNDGMSDIKNNFRQGLNKIISDDSIFSIIEKMFPYMFTQTPEDKEIYSSNRLCSRNKFNLFMTGTLDKDDLSSARFENAVANRNYDDLVAFSKTLSIYQGRRFLSLLVDFVGRTNSIGECDFVLRFLLEDFSNIKMENRILLVSKDYYVCLFVKRLCEKYGSDEAFKLVKQYLNKNSDISVLTELALDLIREEGDGKSQYDFSDEQSKEIIGIVSSIILSKIKGGDFIIPRKAKSIWLVYHYNKEELKDFFDACNDIQKLDLICDMIWIGNVTTNLNGSCLTYSYSIDWIEYLLTNDQVSELINNNFDNLTDLKKQRLLILKMQLSNFKMTEINGNKFYLIKDVAAYCKENNISFKPSDEIERNVY